jgi:hypothetical protein
MAHHAKIENGIVTQVIVTMDSDEDTFADRMLAETGEQWVRTSYNSKIRANFAAFGYIYDAEADVFYAPDPKCHPERILNTDTYQWNCENADHKKIILND